MTARNNAINILHVDDEPDFVDLTATYLEREYDRFEVETATSASEALAQVEIPTVDCIVSDHDMPGTDGIEFLERVREDHPDLPFILYTGKGSEEVASDAISAGVTDYLQKGSGISQYTVLANRIRNAVEEYDARLELADREKRLNLFFEQSPLGVVEWDEEFEVVRMNDAAERILGYSEDALVGRSWEAIVPEPDREPVDRVVSDLLDDAGGYRSVNRNVRANGERIVCEWHNRVVTDDADDVVAIFSQFRDITEETERERKLAKEEAFIEQSLDTLVDIFYFVDTDGDFQRWNSRLSELTGYGDEEIGSMNALEFFDGENRETIRHSIREILETGSHTTEAEITTADGRRVPHEFRGVRMTNDGGEPVGIIGIARDITERKAREEQLEALNQVTQALMSADTRDEVLEIGIETTRDLLGIDVNAIHLYDEDAGGLTPKAATDAMYDLIGDPPTFTGGDSIAWDVYRRGESLKVDDVRENPKRYNPDTPVRSELYLSLGEYGVLTAGSPATGAFDDEDVLLGEILAGGLTRALEQVERTGQLRARERELTEQNDRLEEFASIVSHDLRNPLTVAEGRTELAAMECDSEQLEHVERAHERMRTLIDDLLTLAREGEAVTGVEPVALPALVEGCWANVETGGATLVTDTERTVRADENRLKQLFENLMRNAIEHGGEGVTVTVGELDDGFFIGDDGPGIPEDERERIFDAGYSTREDGTGFGLSIVRRIVEAHDWEIRVTDGAEGGTRFEVTAVEFAAE